VDKEGTEEDRRGRAEDIREDTMEEVEGTLSM
jgi:hypothetical protein